MYKPQFLEDSPQEFDNHFVFVALWNEVYRIKPNADGLHVSREFWEGGTSPPKRLGNMSARLTEQGWQDLKADT